tara:strand:- start:1445 stop:1705 length:261 start_codon:yes stop_codon:yes gene_type:complete
MPSFYLQSIDEDGATTTKSFEASYLDHAVEYVGDFLQGSGFCFDELTVSKSTITEIEEEEVNVVKSEEMLKRVANTTDSIYRQTDV